MYGARRPGIDFKPNLIDPPTPMQPHTFDTNPRGTDSELSTSTAFELASSARRRVVAAVLSDRAEPLPFDELVAEIARSEGVSPADEADAIRLELHHCHLPKLADAGLVRYDRDTNRLTPLPALSRFAEALDLDETDVATRSAN